MSAATEISADAGPAHDQLYRRLRLRIMYGEIPPATSMTLRGVAQEYDVSMTPAREAVRRLNAEGALQLSKSGRVSTPILNNDRIEELAALRALLEPELAARALPRAHISLLDRLNLINSTIEQMSVKRDAIGYIRSNLEFHRTLYLRAQAPSILAIAETVWLQLGPSLRGLYEKRGFQKASENHRKILSALKAGDEPGLRLAMRADVTTSLRMLLE